jgi:hypothetical protein
VSSSVKQCATQRACMCVEVCVCGCVWGGGGGDALGERADAFEQGLVASAQSAGHDEPVPVTHFKRAVQTQIRPPSCPLVRERVEICMCAWRCNKVRPEPLPLVTVLGQPRIIVGELPKQPLLELVHSPLVLPCCRGLNVAVHDIINLGLRACSMQGTSVESLV